MVCLYRVQMDDLTILASATLVVIRPPATRPIRVVRIGASQRSTATSAQLGWILGTKASAFGTYVSATPKKLDEIGVTATTTGGTAAAAGTSGVNASAEGAGTLTTVLSGSFNNLTGLDEYYGERSSLVLAANSSSAWALKLTGTPSPLTNWYAFIDFLEE